MSPSVSEGARKGRLFERKTVGERETDAIQTGKESAIVWRMSSIVRCVEVFEDNEPVRHISARQLKGTLESGWNLNYKSERWKC